MGTSDCQKVSKQSVWRKKISKCVRDDARNLVTIELGVTSHGLHHGCFGTVDGCFADDANRGKIAKLDGDGLYRGCFCSVDMVQSTVRQL